MPKFDTHLCLVSKQPVPNLIPVLDQSFSPRRVVLAVSGEMRSQGKWLSAVIQRHQVLVEMLTVPDAWNFNGCQDVFLDWLTKQPPDKVALNVTGGTKIMAMAAQDIFKETKSPIFYIDMRNDSVIWLDRTRESVILAAGIKLREYLESHGYSVEINGNNRPDILAEKRNLVQNLARENCRLIGGFGHLNWLAQQATETLISPDMNETQCGSEALYELIGMFSRADFLKCDNNKLYFSDEAARKFVNGGWLEFLVYQSLAQLAPTIGLVDCAIGLEVTAPDGVTRNELDVVTLYKNTLCIIECKSADLTRNREAERNAGTEALYKLYALRDFGGLRTKVLLVDSRDSLRTADKRRAEQMRIKIIPGNRLNNLENDLRTWIQGQ